MRTWARRGQTPVLAFNFNYETLSAVAGMTFWNFYFQLFPRSIRSPQVIEFLVHLKRYLRQPLLVIWDRLSAHKSRLTQQWIAEQKGWICTAYLPAYAPELNPVEYLWGYWKQHETTQRLPPRLLGVRRSSATDVETHPPSPTHPESVLEAILFGPWLNYIMRSSIMARQRLIGFIAVIQSVLCLAHGFLYETWTFSPAGTDTPGAFGIKLVFGFLSVSFVAASLLAFRYTNAAVRAFYKAAAVWVGLLTFLLLRALQSDEPRYVKELQAFDDLSLAGASLRRDILEARAEARGDY